MDFLERRFERVRGCPKLTRGDPRQDDAHGRRERRHGEPCQRRRDCDCGNAGVGQRESHGPGDEEREEHGAHLEHPSRPEPVDLATRDGRSAAERHGVDRDDGSGGGVGLAFPAHEQEQRERHHADGEPPDERPSDQPLRVWSPEELAVRVCSGHVERPASAERVRP